MSDRGQEFIRLYNELDHWLKKLTSSRGSVPFWKRIRLAAKQEPALNRYLDDLLEFHELRNAIIHHRSYPQELLATPTAGTVARMEEILGKLLSPQHVIPVFQRDMHVFGPATQLVEVLKYMRHHGYSQVVSRVDGRLKLTTSSGITRWLAAQAEAGECHLAGVTLADILPHDRDGSFMLIRAGATVEEALSIFQQSLHVRRPRLFALVITKNADPGEEPLGIITPRDLLVEE